jgi:polysaccharide export outer membrane protein
MKISKALMAISVFCLFLFPSFLKAAQEPVTGSLNPSEYKIGPENILEIDIYYGKQEKISQRIQVSSKGDVVCPLIGEVHAQGLTVSALQKQLTDMYAKDYLVNPQVIVSITDFSTVSIIGEVKMPGIYQIKGKLTVVELISQAQGFTNIASPNKVKIIRTSPNGTKKEILVRVYDIINKNTKTNGDVDLQGGDVVLVPESML